MSEVPEYTKARRELISRELALKAIIDICKDPSIVGGIGDALVEVHRIAEGEFDGQPAQND